MPKATAKKSTEKKPARRKADAVPAAPPKGTVAKEFEFGLSDPGGDTPDGARRTSCPDCGAKHDVVRTGAVAGQGGMWSVPDFTCIACGHTVPVQPVG